MYVYHSTMAFYVYNSRISLIISDATSPCTLRDSKQAIDIWPIYFAGVAIISGPYCFYSYIACPASDIHENIGIRYDNL